MPEPQINFYAPPNYSYTALCCDFRDDQAEALNQMAHERCKGFDDLLEEALDAYLKIHYPAGY